MATNLYSSSVTTLASFTYSSCILDSWRLTVRPRFFRIALIVSISFFGFTLTSCEDGLRIVDCRVVTYPDRIVYILGVDTELDLTGGVYTMELKDGYIAEFSMTEPNVDAKPVSDVDFSREGVYTVSIGPIQGNCTFAVQVISIESLEELCNPPGLIDPFDQLELPDPAEPVSP